MLVVMVTGYVVMKAKSGSVLNIYESNKTSFARSECHTLITLKFEKSRSRV